MKMLQEYLTVAESYNIPSEMLVASKDVLNEMAKKDNEVIIAWKFTVVRSGNTVEVVHVLN